MGRKSCNADARGDHLMELTDDDVLEILKLFEQSKFDFLQLQQGERKITVSKGGYVASSNAAAPAPATVVAPAAEPLPPKAEAAVPEGLLAITAPMGGQFDAAPSP